MLIDHHREKLISAIIYFVTNTKYCGKLKLFKQLYFLDFEHFAQTGRSVTGLDYYAWEKGPCPKELYGEFDDPKDDMLTALNFEEVPVNKPRPMLTLVPKKQFNPLHFTKREINILKALAEEFYDSVQRTFSKIPILQANRGTGSSKKKASGFPLFPTSMWFPVTTRIFLTKPKTRKSFGMRLNDAWNHSSLQELYLFRCEI